MNKSSDRRFAYLMLLPAALIVVAVVLYPFIYNFIISMSNMSMRNFHSWNIIGFGQYAKVFGEKLFYSVFAKTVIWTVVNVFFHVTLGGMLAMLLNRNLPGKGIFRTLLIIPWAMPQYIAALTWRGMFNYQYGAINLIITRYLSMNPVEWLKSPFEAFTACILTNIWFGFPFMMIIALGGLQSIDRSLYEAAEVDGASRWRQFWSITVPLLRPVMVPAIVLGTIWTFNNLNVMWLVSNGGEPADSTHILVSYVYKAAFNLYRYGYAAAFSVVIFIILLCFSILFVKRTKGTEAAY
jgi:arabinogalactan oligomer/maltooligosaccharide transport system permease protein